MKISVEKVESLHQVSDVICQGEEDVADDDLQDGQLSAAVQVLQLQLRGRGKSGGSKHGEGGVPQDQSGPSHSSQRLHLLDLIRFRGGGSLPHLLHSLLLQ